MRYLVPDKKCQQGLWLKSYSDGGVLYRSKAYKLWSEMKFRCTNLKFQSKYPSYKNCKFSDNFSDYQYFTEWCQKQIGYSLDNYELDKDLLGQGELYSEDTCVFIPKGLNSFLATRPLGGKGNPKGVYPRSGDTKFVASISVDNKSKYLGYFDSIGEAKAAYDNAKMQEVQKWYGKISDGTYVVDPRVILKLNTWTPIL